MRMNEMTPAWPHGPLSQVFRNIYTVRGTNITNFEGVELQFSRNMIVINRKSELTLINTVRLYENGLNELDTLGEVKNIIRIGAFHGRDDAFYINRYPNACFWNIQGMETPSGSLQVNHLTEWGESPLDSLRYIEFSTSKEPEGALLLEQEGGILITCDSIKNWVQPDEYFSKATWDSFQEGGLIGEAGIARIWLQGTGTKEKDFKKILNLEFRHLLSAHGDPLMNDAKKHVAKSVDSIFNSF